MIFNVPNLITLSRIAATMLMWFLFPSYPLAGFPILIYAILSDTLDGYIARKRSSTSTFGAIFDPIADKIFYLGTLWLFRAHITIPLIAIAAFPEIILILIRFLALAGKLQATIPATWMGKCKMGFHCGTLLFLFFASFADWAPLWGLGGILVGFGVVLSGASAISHLKK